MKKFTSHGREAWRPVARNKGGGCGAHGARSTGGEKLGRKSICTSHKKNGRYSNWSQKFWRATKACWKSLCIQLLRTLSIFHSYLLSLCKALPTWLSQGFWKLSSYLAPSADDTTTDRSVERCATQKGATGRMLRKKLAKRTSALSAAKGTSYAGKATSSKQKTDASDKETVPPNECVENAGTSSSTLLAIEPKIVSAGPKGNWVTATGRRGRNRVLQERLQSSLDDRRQFALAQRKTSGALSANAAPMESLKIGNARAVATSTLPAGAAARARSFAPQNEAFSGRVSQSSTTVVTAPRGDAESDKTVSCPPDQGTNIATFLFVSPAAMPAAEGGELCKAVSSKDSCSSGHTLRSAPMNAEDDGFTLATSRSRKPTVRKQTSEFRHFSPGFVLSSDSAGRRTDEAMQQSPLGSRVTVEKNRVDFSRADSLTDSNMRRSPGTREEINSSNNATSHASRVGEKRLYPLQKGGVCGAQGATDASLEKAQKIPGIIKEDGLGREEHIANECLSLHTIAAPHRLEQWLESSTEQKTADTAAEHSCLKNETAQRKAITIPKQTSPPPHAKVQGRKVAQEKTQGEDPQKTKETAGGLDSFAATSTPGQATAVENHACAGEQSPLLSSAEEETAVPAQPVFISTEIAGEEAEELEKVQGRAQQQQQLEQPKRWGDRLSDEEDDMCSWGSRESVEKFTSCFPFTHIPVVSPNFSEVRERTDTPLTAKQVAPKTMPQRKKPGFRTARGLHASTCEHGLSKRHDRQRGAQHVRIPSREQDRHQQSRAAQRAAEFSAFRTSKGPAFPAAQASRMQQERSESLPRAEADAAACWPPLSNTVYLKARKSTAIPISNHAASSLACPVEPFPRQRSSFRPDSATAYSRRPQLQHAKWHPPTGAAAEVGERGVALRNGGNQATTARVQGSSIWRVRDQQPLREVTAGDASRNPLAHSSATKMSGPFNSEQAGSTTQSCSHQQGSASFVEDQNCFKNGVTKFAPRYVTRTDLSTQVLPPPDNTIPETSTPKLSGGHNALLGRAGRRRARFYRRRWDHYAQGSHSRESFHSHVQHQPQTTFYSYGLPPPPPPPPPPAMAFYSTPRTYPRTRGHPYEDCTSHPVPPELLARGMLLPHHQEQQQHQLVGPLHIYSDSGACYVPVPYSTPAALYEAQRQLEYPCAWVYPPTTSVTSQTKAKEIELERGEAGLPGRPHCENVAADPYNGRRSQAQRKQIHNPCDTLAREPAGHEQTWCERNYQIGDPGFNIEGQPHGEHEEHQERQQCGQLPQEQQDNEEQICYEQSRKTKVGCQNDCKPEAGEGQICSRVMVNDGVPMQPIGRTCTSSNPADEGCRNAGHPVGSHASRAAAVTEEADNCLRCGGISAQTVHQVQRCGPMVQQQHQHQHPDISANSLTPPEEEAAAAPDNGTLSLLCQRLSMEKTKKAVAILESADTGAAQVNVVAAPESNALDPRATALCPAAEQHENVRGEGISDCVQHSREEKRKQVEADFSRNEIAATIERTLTDTLETIPAKCRKDAEAAVSRKISGPLFLSDRTDEDKQMGTGPVSARKTAESKDVHTVWAKRGGGVTPSKQIESERNTTSQIYVEPSLQSQKLENADPDRPKQPIPPEREKALFDHNQHESVPQEEETRAFPTKIKSLVRQENEDSISIRRRRHRAQGTQERERTEDTHAAQVVPDKNADSISAGERSQLPVEHKNEKRLAATKTLQHCVQQRKEEESLPDIPIKEGAPLEREARPWTENPSPQQEPRSKELLVQKEGGSVQQRSREEDRAVQQRTGRTKHSPHTKNAERCRARSSTGTRCNCTRK